MNHWKSLASTGLLLVCVGFFSVGCGRANNPAPPPAPQIPNPGNTVPGGGLFFGGGSCGGVPGGIPLSGTNAPYFTQLGNSGSMTLNLAYSGATPAENQMANIVGSAQMVVPDLQYLSPSGSVPQTSFCVSSSNPFSGGAINYGTFTRAYATLSITLVGQIQMPTYNPYMAPGSFFPGQVQQFQPVPVYVSIGSSNGCVAYLREGRLKGCVMIELGQQGYSQPLYYDADSGGISNYYGSVGYQNPYYGGGYY